MPKNLVPESRQDRNGKSVIRWVRDETFDNKGNRIPPAQITIQKKRFDASAIIFPDNNNSVSNQHVIDFLANTMPDILDKLVDAMQGDEDIAENLRTLLKEPYRLTQVPIEETRENFERAFVIHPYTKKMMVLLRLEEDGDSEWTRLVMLRLESLVMDARQTKVIDDNITKALIMTLLMEGHHDDYAETTANEMWVTREDDIRYIAEHLEAVEAIVPELMRRETFARGTVEALVSTPSKSLTSGVL